MRRHQRLRSSADFRRVRDQAARSWAHPLLVLYAAPNDLGQTRIGITVGKRVGKSAVVRNRVRRRIREAVRLRYGDLVPGQDLLLIARPAAVQASWPELRGAVESVISRARLWAPRAPETAT
jgi:ribonuclease P protein component